MPRLPLLPRRRPVWIGLVASLLIAVSLTFAPVRAWAGKFLGIFRVEKVTMVTIDPANLYRFQRDIGRSQPEIERMLSDEIKVVTSGSPRAVASSAEATQLAGFEVRLPSSLEGEPRLAFQPAQTVSLRIDREKIQGILDATGTSDLVLPDAIDGQVVQLDIPASVTAAFGACDTRDAKTPCTVVVQMRSPVVSAPVGLDMAQVGEAALRLLGMSPEEAVRTATSIDWATTLVIPLPAGNGMSVEDVTVDGVAGTLFALPGRSAATLGVYGVIWVKDGILHAVRGRGGRDDALTVADSLR